MATAVFKEGIPRCLSFATADHLKSPCPPRVPGDCQHLDELRALGTDLLWWARRTWCVMNWDDARWRECV